MREIQAGAGVVPGRYAGRAVPVHAGPTPQQEELTADKAAAEQLAARICAAAAMAARSECQLVDLVGEFDAADAVRWWVGVKSLAHWLSWTCSMSPGAAREHVRVARALRRMPTVHAAFADGRLSYSKVREVTRVVDVVDEAELCAMALTATAAQLSRIIVGYRTADGLRMSQEIKREVRWRSRDDGMVELSARLPPEEAAVVRAALTAAKDQHPPPPPPEATAAELIVDTQTDTQPVYSAADALLDVAHRFLESVPDDRSGEDRTLVVVHVAAEQLGAGAADVPAETSGREAPVGAAPVGAVCHVDGVGPVAPETARRLACDSTLLGMVVDRSGEVLTLGRTRRLVSRAQRRALMVRDRMCRFPGCAQTRHLQAHHRISWANGGPTDLDNLILLCRFHHTCVHEGGMTIQRAADAEGGWEFRMPDGSRHRPWYSAAGLPALLKAQLDRHRAVEAARLAEVDGLAHPDARTIRPGWTGDPFDLHACVQALFDVKLPTDSAEEISEAAA